MRRYLLLGLFCLGSQSVVAGDNEQVQGQGGRILNYSSTQIRVEPTAEDIRNYQQARDRMVDGASLSAALQAGRRALQQLGYNRVDVDAEFGVIRAEKDEVLISQARQVLRGLLKLKFPLPGKPDHQTTELLLTLRNGALPRQVWLRAQMRQTIWDSNGNSRTLLLSDPASYGQVYDKLTAALNGQG